MVRRHERQTGRVVLRDINLGAFIFAVVKGVDDGEEGDEGDGGEAAKGKVMMAEQTWRWFLSASVSRAQP